MKQSGIEFLLKLKDKLTAPLKNIQKIKDDLKKGVNINSKLKGGVDVVKQLTQVKEKITAVVGTKTVNVKANVSGEDGISRLTSKVNFLKNLNLLQIGVQVAQGVMGVAGSVFKAGSDMEQANIAFTTFLGSADAAKSKIKELQDFADVSPFDTPQVIGAGKALLGLGVDAKNLMPTMKTLGDISAGTGKDFNELAVMYGKMKSAGFAQNDSLNQMAEAGIPIFQQLSQIMGKSVGEVRKLAEDGLDVKLIEKAFQNVTTEGGLFFNMMDAQSKSTAGQWSTLVSQINNMGIKLFQNLQPFLNGAITLFGEILAKVGALKPIFDKINVALNPVRDAFAKLSESLGGIGGNGSIAEKVLNTIGSALVFMMPFISKIMEFGAEIVNIIANIINMVMKVTWVNKLIGGLVEGFKAAFLAIVDIAKNTIGGVADLVIGILSGDLDMIKGAMGKLGLALKGMFGGKAAEIGKGIVKGFEDGIGNGIDLFKNKSKDLITPQSFTQGIDPGDVSKIKVGKGKKSKSLSDRADSIAGDSKSQKNITINNNKELVSIRIDKVMSEKSLPDLIKEVTRILEEEILRTIRNVETAI